MSDLAALNRRFSALGGKSIPDLQNCPVVLATLKASVEGMRQCLSNPNGRVRNTPEIIESNRAWLEYARLGSKDALGGQVFLLVELHITLDQANFFQALTNEQITKLSEEWDGLIASPIPAESCHVTTDPHVSGICAASAITAFEV